MEKFVKLNYNEVETKKVSKFESSFTVKPLERGFGNTLGNAMRRTILSSITGVAPFALKINGANHEFQTVNGVTEDVVQLVLNIKTIRFIYNSEVFQDGEVIKVSLTSPKGEVRAKDLILPPGVEVVNPDHYIGTAAKADALEFDLFLRSGRGFMSYEENKETIKELQAKMESKIKSGSYIAIDSDFSPVVNVSYESVELNAASAQIQEKLTLNVKTDGSLEAKEALAQAANILMAHLDLMADVFNLERDEVFTEAVKEADKSAIQPLAITSLDLSVRSYNCLKRAGYETLDDLAKLTLREVKSIKNLGAKSVDEIIDKLTEHEITLEEGE